MYLKIFKKKLQKNMIIFLLFLTRAKNVTKRKSTQSLLFLEFVLFLS